MRPTAAFIIHPLKRQIRSRVVLLFKDLVSAEVVKKELKDLSLKVHTTIQLVFLNPKTEQELTLKETKPPIVNQKCVAYGIQYDLYDADYVDYTRTHLYNRVKRQKQQSAAIAKHYTNMPGTMPQDLLKCFKILKKCRNKFACLVYEMLFIIQAKSLRAIKLYSRAKIFIFYDLRTLLC